MNTDLKKKQKMILKKISKNDFEKNVVLKIVWKMWENRDSIWESIRESIRESIWCQNQVKILQRFSQEIY